MSHMEFVGKAVRVTRGRSLGFANQGYRMLMNGTFGPEDRYREPINELI